MPADGGCSSNGKENYCRPGGKGPVIGKVIPKSRITEFYMKKQLAPVIPEKTESFQINNFRQKTENRRKQKKRNGTEFDIVFFHGNDLRNQLEVIYQGPTVQFMLFLNNFNWN